MSRWKKMWKWGFRVSETDSKLLLDKNLQPGAPPSLSQTFHGLKISTCNLRGKIKL